MASARYGDWIKQREDAGYTLFPVGTYDVKVVNAEVPQKSGTMGFIVQFEVTTGPLAGRKFKHWMTLSEVVRTQYPGLIDLWFKEMAALGLSEQFFEREPSDEQVMNALMGRTARAEVGRRTKKNSDEETENIKVFPPTTPQAAVGAPAADPMAMSGAPAADPSAPGLPPF